MAGNWGSHVEPFSEDPEKFSRDSMVRSGWCGCVIFFGLVVVVLAIIFVTISHAAY